MCCIMTDPSIWLGARLWVVVVLLRSVIGLRLAAWHFKLSVLVVVCVWLAGVAATCRLLGGFEGCCGAFHYECFPICTSARAVVAA